ncbi:MAG: NADH-quinone oxidoreductase subunit NuoN [Gammaproteobacteria bacterium]|jgi:NADH-quinone oxidoreductase subunit N|nr:NADH-quinone oxidoreductase subunit NuoN [Gammaproteobacteria bacterium]
MTAVDLMLALPELFILFMTCVIMLVGLWLPRDRQGLISFMSVMTLVFAAIILLGWDDSNPSAVDYAFNATFVRDQMADVLKLTAFILLGAIFIYARQYLRVFKVAILEYHVLSLFMLLGAMVLISSASMLTVYLGLELIALPSYALVALRRDDPRATEAAMKYFVLGSLASGLLLYGLSMIYGVTGTLSLAQVANITSMGNNTVLVLGLIFVVIGIAFKLGVVPLHMWIPDVYEGAPAAVTILISSVPKLAAFAMAIRLLSDGMGNMQAHWMSMLVVLATLSIVLGNLVAIAQSNLKRMLAYSTIAHMGFMLLGLLTGTDQGFSASMFYAIVYAIMAAGAFAVIILLSQHGVEAENLDDYKGLNKRSPWLALMMLMLMFSLAGVPVFAGFFAKWLVIQAVLDAGMVWLAVLAVVFSVIGAFYYLRVVKLMYFDEPDSDEAIIVPADFRAALTLNGSAQLLLGIFANILIALCVASF